MRKPLIHAPLHFGENTRIDIQRDLNGGVMLVIREMSQPAKTYRIPRESGIGMAMALMEAAGIPIQEAFARQQALRNNGQA